MLVCQVHHTMAGQNVKKKYLICQIPIKMLKQESTPNSSLHNLNIHLPIGCRKTSQRWIYVASYVAIYLANTAILAKYSDFQQKISLQIISFCFKWWIHFLLTLRSILPSVLQRKWCQDFRNSILFYSMLANHHVYYRLARLTGTFKIIAINF